MGLTTAKNRIIGFIWGFTEAVFFFLVPDIWLSRLALKDLRAAFDCLIFTTLGALLGGYGMYVVGQAYFTVATKFLDAIPAISPAMVENGGNAVINDGLLPALFAGMAAGMPYKIYAVWSGHLAIAPLAFVAATVSARMARFAIVTLVYYMGARIFARHVSDKTILRVHLISWVAFYAFYFWTFGIF